MTSQVGIKHHEGVCYHNISHYHTSHPPALPLVATPSLSLHKSLMSKLMSEQSFCYRQLFIVSLLASLNPHYIQSISPTLSTLISSLHVNSGLNIFLELYSLDWDCQTWFEYKLQDTLQIPETTSNWICFVMKYDGYALLGLVSIYCKFSFVSVSTLGKSVLLSTIKYK